MFFSVVFVSLQSVNNDFDSSLKIIFPLGKTSYVICNLSDTSKQHYAIMLIQGDIDYSSLYLPILFIGEYNDEFKDYKYDN